jgi:adenosylcobinamide kinase/adenosylcobinamide-phosphate guanylyltransferase
LQVRDKRWARFSQAGTLFMTVVLVLGGARSGKSRIAQEMAEAEAGPLNFVATAESVDSEMAERIARHKADRGVRWRVFEAPIELPQVLASEQTATGTTLVDCLTVWLGNLMHYGHNIEAAIDELITVLQRPRLHPLYLVSNEVGQGIVPDNPMARAFRDYAGRMNQSVARAAQRVLFVTAGIAQTLK